MPASDNPNVPSALIPAAPETIDCAEDIYATVDTANNRVTSSIGVLPEEWDYDWLNDRLDFGGSLNMSLSLSYLSKPHALSLNDGSSITAFNDGTIIPDRYQLPIWNGSENPFHSGNLSQIANDSSAAGISWHSSIDSYAVNIPQKALELTRAGIGPFGDLKVAGKRYPPALQSANKYTLAAVPDDPSDRSSTAVPTPVVDLSSLSATNSVLEIVLTAAMGSVDCGDATLGGDNTLTGIKTEYDDHSSGTDGMTRCVYGTGTGAGQAVTKDAGAHALTAQPMVSSTPIDVSMNVELEGTGVPGINAYFSLNGTTEVRTRDVVTVNAVPETAAAPASQSAPTGREVNITLRPESSFEQDDLTLRLDYEVLPVMSDGTDGTAVTTGTAVFERIKEARPTVKISFDVPLQTIGASVTEKFRVSLAEAGTNRKPAPARRPLISPRALT